jgi:hypothetical protein
VAARADVGLALSADAAAQVWVESQVAFDWSTEKRWVPPAHGTWVVRLNGLSAETSDSVTCP